jgi:hypothetical protein
MTAMRSLHPLNLVALAVVGFAAIFAACGSSGDDPALQDGPLKCDGMGTHSYHYTVNAAQEVKEFTGTVAPSPRPQDVPHGPVKLSWDVQGALEGGKTVGDIDAKQHNVAGGASGDIETIALETGDAFYDLGSGWTKNDNPSRPPPIQFEPRIVCNSIAPDIDTTKLGTGTSETINGTPSKKYTFDNLPSGYWRRQPDFGGGSDVGNNVGTISGSIWIAEKGNMITKLDVHATGAYPNGQEIDVSVKMELSDVGGDVKVEAPL